MRTSVSTLILCVTCLFFAGCSSVSRVFTGLPPNVKVSKEEKFSPWLANQVAVIVLVPRGVTAIDHQAVTRQLTDVAEGELLRLGYKILAGKTLPSVLAAQPWTGDLAQFDPLPIAKEAGADLVVVVTLTEIDERTEYSSDGHALQKVRFNAGAKAMGVASGRIGWIATAAGEASPRDGGAQYVAGEVTRALVAAFPAKAPTKTP